MSSGDNPIRQLADAWQAAAAVAAEWAERTAAVTADALHKLTSDPAIQAVLESWRTAFAGSWGACECSCADAHPGDIGVCDNRAVITRRIRTPGAGAVDVSLCAPCAVAQGVAEMPS
jgi:hypothetical protein